MSIYKATIIWKRDNQSFIDHKYSRAHQWHFAGNTIVEASASHHIVPLPYSVKENVDPEEAFVASLSSCHMLFYLDIAAKMKLVVDSYTDNASGILEKNPEGSMAMTRVTLDPVISYSGTAATTGQEKKIHHLAHQECFIANSVKTLVTVKGFN